MRSEVFFIDEKLKITYQRLSTSKADEQELYKWVSRAINDLKENAFCGIQIPKRLIPHEYTLKYKIDNLWKYDLPRGWRILYSVAKEGVMLISIIIEWMDHKNYERRFKY